MGGEVKLRYHNKKRANFFLTLELMPSTVRVLETVENTAAKTWHYGFSRKLTS